MNIFLGQPVLTSLNSPPTPYTANCFPSLTKHTLFAMLGKRKDNS
jgi:hypothetical protein